MNDKLIADLDAGGFARARDGGTVLCGSAERLFAAWQGLLLELLRSHAAAIVLAPAFIDERVLGDSGYGAHFPHQVFVCSNAMRPAGPRYTLTPAACLHVYPRLRGCVLGDEPSVAVVRAQCARYESGRWEFPFRSPVFHMIELVAVGSPQRVGELHDRVSGRVLAALDRLGLSVEVRPATDAFFLGERDGASLVQRIKELKKELVVAVDGDEVAVGSINRHETRFGERFDIRIDANTPASSFCIAFGVERLVAWGLLTWGVEPGEWPAEMRRHEWSDLP